MIEKKQLTVRLPQSIFNYLTAKSESDNKSLNDVIIEITEEHLKWHQAEKTISEIASLRQQNKNVSGIHPDSTEELNRMRDGIR